MTFNLVHQAWIPIRRAAGAVEVIRPAAIVDGLHDDPVMALASPRADFDGALAELLVGLLTGSGGIGEDVWLDWWETPPDVAALQARLDPIAHAFDLDGDGPRAFQDLDPLDGDEIPVERLLIEAPGDQSIRRNTDLFARRDRVRHLSRAAAAAALVTLQTYAPSGGRGHRTSLRGGGPLTTLIVPDIDGRPAPLWHRLWANVPSAAWLADRPARAVLRAADRFPWLAPTRVSAKGEKTTPEDADPLQAFWGLPRRIRLAFAPAPTGARCDLYGIEDAVMVAGFRARPFGVNYEGGWRHPLSPYTVEAGKPPLPRHGSPRGVSYRHWLGLVQEDGADGPTARVPAAPVTDWRWRGPELDGVTARLVAFGYDMDNMKARAWCGGEMPVHAVPAETRGAFEGRTAVLIHGAQEAAGLTTRQIKAALFRSTRDAAGDFAPVEDRFWQETEPAFFALLTDLVAISGDTDAWGALRWDWCRTLRREAERLFDEAVPPQRVEIDRIGRLVQARKWLVRGFRGNGSVVRRLEIASHQARAA